MRTCWRSSGNAYIDVVPYDILRRDFDELLRHHQRLAQSLVSAICQPLITETCLMVAHTLREYVRAELQVALDESTSLRFPFAQIVPHLINLLVQPRNFILNEYRSSCCEENAQRERTLHHSIVSTFLPHKPRNPSRCRGLLFGGTWAINVSIFAASTGLLGSALLVLPVSLKLGIVSGYCPGI